jgi:hypothetical protein
VPGLVFGGTEGIGPVFIFCAPVLFFDGPKGDGSCFHVLRIGTCYRRYGGRRVPFSCFARLDTFLAETRVSGAVFMFYAPEVVSHDTEGVVSRFQVLRSRTRFWRYRRHRVPLSSFPLPDSFSSVSRATGPVFMFYTLGQIFGGIEGVGSCFHVLRSRIYFRQYGGRQVPFSCLATEAVGSRFHVLRSRTYFRRYRGRSIPFSCFALPDMFSAVLRASGPVFMFCALGLIFGGIGFSVVPSFRRYRGRPVLFSCFALPYMF